MTASDSLGCDEMTSAEGFSRRSSVTCPKCGQKDCSLDANGVTSDAVVACVKCDYSSIDNDVVPDKSDSEGNLEDGEVDKNPQEDEISAKSVDDAELESVNNRDEDTGSLDTIPVIKCTICENVEDNLVSKISYPDGETVAHYCRTCNQFMSGWSFKCEECGNCSPDWFHDATNGAGNQLVCLVCLKVSKPTNILELSNLLQRISEVKEAKISLARKKTRTCKRVKDLKQLRIGDHIAWDREYLVWHHAIVTDVVAEAGQLTVIHNSGGIKDLPNGRIASVRVETFDVNCDDEFLYMFEYNEDECFTPEEVIERATQRLDEVYDPLTNNCEHYARWCKTGVKYSVQRKDFDDRLKMGASGFAKVIEESLMTAVRFYGKSESMHDILGISAKDAWAIVEARLGVPALTDSTNVVCFLQLGAILMGVMLAIFAEIIFFCCKLYEAKRDTDAKHMPAEVFIRGVVQLFSEGMVGLGGGLAVAFGMSLIPYAGVFLSPVGYVLGNWVGRFLGALIGRLTMRILFRYKLILDS